MDENTLSDAAMEFVASHGEEAWQWVCARMGREYSAEVKEIFLAGLGMGFGVAVATMFELTKGDE